MNFSTEDNFLVISDCRNLFNCNLKKFVNEFIHVPGYWKCKTPYFTQNTWQQTRYFNVDFDSKGLLFFFYIPRKYVQFRKIQKHLLEKNFASNYFSN